MRTKPKAINSSLSLLRRRRLRDLLRLGPLAALLGFMLPLLWSARSAAIATAWAGVYIFLIWAAMIVATFLLGRASKSLPDDDMRQNAKSLTR